MKQMRNPMSNPIAMNTMFRNRGIESASGTGSSLENTEEIREALPYIIREYNIRSIIDCPCGDCYWMNRIDLIGVDYLGLDIDPSVIATAVSRMPGKNFQVFNVLKQKLPKSDLIICRDFFIHLPFSHIKSVLANINSKYLLATTFDYLEENKDIKGHYGFRPVNLEIDPINIDKPVLYEIQEKDNDACANRKLKLWEWNND